MRGYRLRAYVTAAMMALAAASGRANAATCPVSAVAAFDTARANGFGFDVVKSTSTQCKLVASTIIVAAPSAAASECTFSVLTNRPLATGWKLVRLQLSGEANQLPLPPITQQVMLAGGQTVAETQTPPGRLVKISVVAGHTVTVSIKKVVISGPDCGDAMTAFE
jgi:hypothetical protein